MSLPTARYRQLLDAIAVECALPGWKQFPAGVWLEALVMQESSGNPLARRYEPHHDVAGRKDAASDGDKIGQDDGLLEDDASYGLMQVLGSNVRRIIGAPPGTPLHFDFLMRPLAGIAFGLRVLLDELRVSHNDVDQALARYNGGSTGAMLIPTTSPDGP